MKASHTNQKGLTLIELLVVIAVLAVLFGISTVSILNIRVVTTNSTTTSVIISDLKNQQVRAMTGDTEGRGTPDNYGIKILANSYVLFHGNSYNPSDTSNFSVPVSSGYQLSSTFPNNLIIFTSGSGELVNFVPNQNTITLIYISSGQSKTITLNKYGTVTSIN